MADSGREGSVGNIMLAFIVGAAIGGGLALLTAPRSGKETRDRLKQTADEMREQIKQTTAEAETRIKHAVEEGRELLKGKTEVIKSVVEAGREALAEEKTKHS